MKKLRKQRTVAQKDLVKEARYRSLVKIFQEAGFEVRREKLKRGLGWRAHSGACRLTSQELIFVDQRLSQDDQIGFLKERAVLLGIDLSAESESV